MKPTLHVTNWSSRKLHGPGRKLTIMAAPRRWEHGEAVVDALVPALEDLRAVQGGQISVDEYQRAFEKRTARVFHAGGLAPGSLFGRRHIGSRAYTNVEDGDTLLCACSRDEAAAGRCHRVWVARALVRAGWSVVLDGVELEVVDGT